MIIIFEGFYKRQNYASVFYKITFCKENSYIYNKLLSEYNSLDIIDSDQVQSILDNTLITIDNISMSDYTWKITY